MKRAVITAVGKDSVGRFAEICNYLAEKEINILDVSQTHYEIGRASCRERV